MITARNYAAQAEKDLIDHENGFVPHETAKMFASIIKHATHFAIPDNGVIFDDNLKGIRNERIRLPFPDMTIEWMYDKAMAGTSPSKILLIAKEITKNDIAEASVIDYESIVGDAVIHVTACVKLSGIWGILPLSLFVDSAWDAKRGVECFNVLTSKNEVIDEKSDGVMGVIVPIKNSVLELSNDKTVKMFYQIFMTYCRALFELCEALSCSNVTSDVLQPDSPKNAKRISDKKLPIYETRCLSIIAPTTTSGRSEGLGGTHRSPRQHLRRGHIRRIAEERKIWVNSCVVGAKSQGVIEKTYTVST